MRRSPKLLLTTACLILLPQVLCAQSVKIIRPKFEPCQSKLPHLLPHHQLQRPRVALVLSGGGARGISQIGVLRVLEKHNIPIDLIVGTSMGAIIGGLYASGYSPDDLKAIVDSTNWEEILAFSDEARRSDLFVEQKARQGRGFLVIRLEGLQPIIPSAISSGQRFTTMLNRLVFQGIYHAASSFDDLKIPFRSVVTDLVTGRRVVLHSGDLTEAMRASATVPLLFSPVEKDSMLLMDGGLVSNIPVDVARESGVDLVIAVNTTSGFRSADQLEAPWETADQIVNVMQQLSNKEQLRKADIIITPRLGNHLSSEFSKLDSLIHLGEQAGEEKVGEILARLKFPKHLTSNTVAGSNGKVIVDFKGDPIPDTLRSAILAAHEMEFNEKFVEEALGMIYSVGNYADVYAELYEDPSGLNLTYVAKYNPVLRDVRLKGTQLVPDSLLSREFSSLLGRVINHRETHRALEAIIRRYRAVGYSLARIDSVYFDDATGIATIWIDEGRIADLRIDGNERTKEYVILREFPLAAGDFFALGWATQGVNHIMSTNLFQSVLLGVTYENDKPIVVIKVKEKSPELLRLGIRGDNERNTQFAIDLRNDNFHGTGTEIGFSFSGGGRNRNFRLEYRTNRIFDSYFSFDLAAYHQFRDIYTYGNGPSTRISRWVREQIGEYRQIRYGGSLRLGTQVGRLGNVTGEVRVENHQVRGLDGLGYTPDRFRLVALRLGSTIDTENRYPFPTEGMFMKTFYEWAISELGSKVSYSKLYFTYEYFSTHFRIHTFHPKITFGYADETLPLTEQFSLGGQDSFFGLREDDRRGRQIFSINFEYRLRLPVKLIFDTYLKVRYDLGSVWRIPEDIRLRDLHHGVGIELALDTPIGPAQFAVGRSFLFRRDLLNNPLSFGPYQVYFSFGYRLF